ncbi:hypothetical protein ACFY1C_30050 [Streptomyces sp. NPDC001279]|uniref:hypothetical protein n=1 Tax=Streptomyces sp. NPDC001279 TaxID=3364556 RepID=UPI00367874C3
MVVTGQGDVLEVDRALPTVAAVLYDAVLLPDGTGFTDDAVRRFVRNAYRQAKPIGGYGRGSAALEGLLPAAVTDRSAAAGGGLAETRGVVTAAVGDSHFGEAFASAVAAHRHWDRPSLA